jgi:hypothetical protein
VEELAATQAPELGPPDLRDVTVYRWDSAREVWLLALLQEGLSRRIETEATPRLRAAVAALLSPRWEEGDLVDRVRVLLLGGLLPTDTLEGYVAAAMESGTPRLRRACVMAMSRVQEVPAELAARARLELAGLVLAAQTRESLIELEMLAAGMPYSIGALHVYERCHRLRWVGVAVTAFLWPAAAFTWFRARLRRRSWAPMTLQPAHIALVGMYLTGIPLSLMWLEPMNSNPVAVGSSVSMTVLGAALLVAVACRDADAPLGWAWISRLWSKLRGPEARRFGYSILGIGPIWILHQNYSGLLEFLAPAFAVGLLIWTTGKAWAHRRRLRRLVATGESRRVLLRARTVAELGDWLEDKMSRSAIGSISDARAMARICIDVRRFLVLWESRAVADELQARPLGKRRILSILEEHDALSGELNRLFDVSREA